MEKNNIISLVAPLVILVVVFLFLKNKLAKKKAEQSSNGSIVPMYPNGSTQDNSVGSGDSIVPTTSGTIDLSSDYRPSFCKWNNPGNIRFTSEPWRGKLAKPINGSFEEFETLEYGTRAMLKLLKNYINLNNRNTVRKIISAWAPSSENRTDVYINNVCKWTGFGSDEVLTLNRDTLAKLGTAISMQEKARKGNSTEGVDEILSYGFCMSVLQQFGDIV